MTDMVFFRIDKWGSAPIDERVNSVDIPFYRVSLSLDGELQDQRVEAINCMHLWLLNATPKSCVTVLRQPMT
jgi:hypothetical protein